MEKEINTEWVNAVLNNESKSEYSGDLPEIDWLRGGKDYKRQLTFKVLPANSRENKIFSWIVATHWLTTNSGTKRFVCPEQTEHLKKAGVKCPICEAKRRLLKAGFTSEDLSVQGKFGLVPVFDPRIQTNLKVVVTNSDMRQDWDKAHVSILQQNGSFLTKWMVEKHIDKEIPDFTSWEHSNLIKFSRQMDNSKWERDVTFVQFNPTEEVLTKLKEENEALVMPDLWKMPDDQSFVEISNVVKTLEDDYMRAKEAFKEEQADNIQNTQSAEDDDKIPF